MSLLAVRSLSLSFGGIRALENVSLSVDSGQVLALIGPNGSGKTSLFNCICGAYKPTEGEIRLGGRALNSLRPDAIARFGVGRTFQNIRLFHQLTALENIMLGRHQHYHLGFFSALIGHLAREVEQKAKAEEIVEFLGLEAVRKTRAGDVPFGIQRKIELGRALALEPRLLLLDEPAAGLTSEEKQELVYYIREIRGRLKPGIILVEHDLSMAAGAADRMLALSSGRVIAEGLPSAVQNNPEVQRVYLG